MADDFRGCDCGSGQFLLRKITSAGAQIVYRGATNFQFLIQSSSNWLAWSLLSWLARLPLVAFTSLFLPPWIEAQRESGPTIHMIWRARNRFVGPKVLDEIAANVRRGDYRTQVANATFEGFGA